MSNTPKYFSLGLFISVNLLFLRLVSWRSLQILCVEIAIPDFHTQGPGNQSICLSGQKILATIFVMKTQTENITKYSEVKRQTVHGGQTELNNMLVRKNVLNEINKEGTFTQGFNDCRKIKRKVSQNLDDLLNLVIKFTIKVSSEKAQVGLLYDFPFSLNPGDKPNYDQA